MDRSDSFTVFSQCLAEAEHCETYLEYVILGEIMDDCRSQMSEVENEIAYDIQERRLQFWMWRKYIHEKTELERRVYGNPVGD